MQTVISEKDQSVTLDDYIIKFFINLYKLQIGASDLDIGEAVLSEPSTHDYGKDKTYILNVKHKGKLSSRRMSIGKLGDNIANKSICFKVIYDDILVVKVPPQPITEFEEYIENISAERQVAEQLSGLVNCVTPSIAVILKKIPFFQDKERLSLSELENKYIALLKEKPGLQNNLKIGKTFVIFMSLSKYSFFDQVISKLHNAEAEMQSEIKRNIDALWDIEIFENLYGVHHNTIFSKINTVCTTFEQMMASLLKKHDLTTAVPAFKIKEWLTVYLTLNKIKLESDDMPSGFIDDLNLFQTRFLKKFKTDMHNYRKMITQYVTQKNFAQHNTKFKGIIENTLDIMGKLTKRQVAIRDLKPDNMFVVADPEMPTTLLASPEKYSLGLIDFETSICYNTSNDSQIVQPLLAGTPSYATPSHLFSNEVLQSIFGDLTRVLYLQDWYAIIGIIYNVVTGDVLFADTGKLLAEIMMLSQRLGSDNTGLANLYKNSSWVFWHSAVNEYNLKTRMNAKYFKNIIVEMPADGNPMLALNPDIEKTRLAETIAMRISSQKIFKNSKTRQELIKASPKKIRKLLHNWETGVNVPATKPELKTGIIKFLQDLERAKSLMRLYTQAVSALKQEHPKLQVDHLLETVFNLVLEASYHDDWSDRVPPRVRLS
ncbi:hypothetical protein QUF90_10180 [Desulfococcaceae bacterium HSG9]|nr:hypothetical protein [Desulfococcaceae bacterium HSG9]